MEMSYVLVAGAIFALFSLENNAVDKQLFLAAVCLALVFVFFSVVYRILVLPVLSYFFLRLKLRYFTKKYHNVDTVAYEDL